MKKFTQNDVEMAMRREKEKIKKRVQRQKGQIVRRRKRKKKMHIMYWSVQLIML